MRIILYSFLLLIFAFEYYSWRFPGMHRFGRNGRGPVRFPTPRPYSSLYRQRANSLNRQYSGLRRMGSGLTRDAAMFKRTNGRKKRDLYETFKKVPGRD